MERGKWHEGLKEEGCRRETGSSRDGRNHR